jgi:hypothetical protein
MKDNADERLRTMGTLRIAVAITIGSACGDDNPSIPATEGTDRTSSSCQADRGNRTLAGFGLRRAG